MTGLIRTPHRVEWGLPPPALPHQWETFTSSAKVTLQSGAYGSGKTLTNAWVVLRECAMYPGNLILAGAETTPQLRETLQADFDTLIADLIACGQVKFNAQRRLYTFWNGSKALFWPLVGTNAKAMRHRLRSLNLGGAVIEEGTSIPKATLLEILGRLRRKNASRRLWMSCNPDSPEHYLYDLFVRQPRPGWRIIYSNTYANPYLPADYLRNLEASLGPELASRYLKGEWVNFEGLVFKDFRRTLDDGRPWHVLPDATVRALTARPVYRWGALDFGGANPHALLRFAEDAAGYWYVTGEWYRAQVGLQELAAEILRDPVSPIYRDHDLADALTLKNMGVSGLTAARKEKMSGLATMQALMRPAGPGLPPLLRISDACPNLIRELGNYRWPEGTSARDPGNEPVKKDDHAIDACRYGTHTRRPLGLRANGAAAGAVLSG